MTPFELGYKAHKKGISIPAMDKELLKLLEGRKIGNPNTILDMKEWYRGWTEANINEK